MNWVSMFVPGFISDRVPGRNEHRLPSHKIQNVESKEILANKETGKTLEGTKTDRTYQILLMDNPD